MRPVHIVSFIDASACHGQVAGAFIMSPCCLLVIKVHKLRADTSY